MEIEELKPGLNVWTMIGNYPYEVVILTIHDYRYLKPRGTYQYDFVTVWRKEKGTTHDKKLWQLFRNKMELKKHLFPE